MTDAVDHVRAAGRFLLAVVVVATGAIACSASSSGGAAGPGSSTPTPAPTFTQLGTLAVSEVLDHRPITSGTRCPTATQAFPHDVVGSRDFAVCDPRARRVLLLAPPVLDQTAVAATTVAHQPDGTWSAFLQLSTSSGQAFLGLTGKEFAVVFDGVAFEPPAVGAGGIQGTLLQITGLSRRLAHRIAADLNPS